MRLTEQISRATAEVNTNFSSWSSKTTHLEAVLQFNSKKTHLAAVVSELN